MSDDSRTRPTEDDEGKNVLDADGERVGLVAAVEGGTLHVETDPGITDDLKAALGWTDAEDTRTIHESEVERISDDTVHLASSAGGTDADAGTADTEDSVEPGTGSSSGVGTGTGTVDEGEPVTGTAEVDDREETTTPRSTGAAGSEEDDTEVSEMPMGDTGDVTTAETTESGGSGEMSETGIDEAVDDQATEEMGVPGEEAGERSPGVEEPGSGSGVEDVQDPVPDEPRDAEDARELAEELDEDGNAEGPTDDPEDQPSVGEAATRGVEEEDAELGADEREDRDDRETR